MEKRKKHKITSIEFPDGKGRINLLDGYSGEFTMEFYNKPMTTPTHTTEERKILGDEIMKEIDFLCDHWVEHDNKAPYSFGGWREEVQEKLVDIYLDKLHSKLTALLEETEKMRKGTDSAFDLMPEIRQEEIKQGGVATADRGVGYNEAISDLQTLIRNLIKIEIWTN